MISYRLINAAYNFLIILEPLIYITFLIYTTRTTNNVPTL